MQLPSPRLVASSPSSPAGVWPGPWPCNGQGSSQTSLSQQPLPIRVRQCRPNVQRRAASRISVDGQPSPSSRPNPSSAYQAGYGRDWVKQLEADAPFDDEVAQLLDGANRDPEVIRQRMRAAMAAKQREITQESYGEDEQMKVKFREVDPFDLWVWLELYRTPSEEDRELVSEVFQSWYMLGRLGGFNGMNMQVFYKGGDDTSYMAYDAEECESSLNAFIHEMTDLETKGCWMRAWLNMGTADELAMDVLINALSTLSKENVGIKQLIIGGEMAHWKTPVRDEGKTGMDPMALDPMDGADDEY